MQQERLALKQFVFSRTCRMILIGCFALFGVLYIMQTSSVSTKGFEISELQGQVRMLENETRSLDVEIAQYRSMKSIQQRLDGMELVEAHNIEYVTPVGTAVALR